MRTHLSHAELAVPLGSDVAGHQVRAPDEREVGRASHVAPHACLRRDQAAADTAARRIDPCPPKFQRARLREFMAAIHAKKSSLLRDSCGDWAITGSQGCVYCAPGGFQLVITSMVARPRRWSNIKKALSFCELQNDGDDEGILFLDRLPTISEAGPIRQALGIHKHRDITPEQKDKLRAMGYGGGDRAVLDARGKALQRPENGRRPVGEPTTVASAHQAQDLALDDPACVVTGPRRDGGQ
jgi:hypothetical protein